MVQSNQNSSKDKRIQILKKLILKEFRSKNSFIEMLTEDNSRNWFDRKYLKIENHLATRIMAKNSIRLWETRQENPTSLSVTCSLEDIKYPTSFVISQNLLAHSSCFLLRYNGCNNLIVENEDAIQASSMEMEQSGQGRNDFSYIHFF